MAEVVKIIDTGLATAWKDNKVTPADRCNDYEFIRRATLDIVGRIAKAPEMDRYFKDPKETRRAQLVDRLLNSEDYCRNWANIWTNWLLTRLRRIRPRRISRRDALLARGPVCAEQELQGPGFELDRPEGGRESEEQARQGRAAPRENKDNGAVNFILAHVGEAVPGRNKAEEGQFEMVPITSRITPPVPGHPDPVHPVPRPPVRRSTSRTTSGAVNAFLRQVRREGNPAHAAKQMGRTRPDAGRAEPT